MIRKEPVKRTSVLLPADLAFQLELEAERRGVTHSVVLREAVAAYVAARPAKRGVMKIAGAFSSGHSDTAERSDEILEELAEEQARRNAI
jgi:hypothetical protein